MDIEPSHWTSKDQDLFEKYLLDEMDTFERTDFESALKSNSHLNSKFLEFKQFFRAIEEDRLRSKLNSLHKKLEKDFKTKPIHPTLYRPSIRVAAVILFLISLGGIFYFYIPKRSNEKLFKTYFTPDPGLPTVMGNSDNYDFYEAMVYYKQGNFNTALQKWNKLLPQNMDNDTINYFLGSAYLANGEPDKAINCFNRVLDKSQASFKSEAALYKGLAHLKKNEVKEALHSLEQTSDKKGMELVRILND